MTRKRLNQLGAALVGCTMFAVASECLAGTIPAGTLSIELQNPGTCQSETTIVLELWMRDIENTNVDAFQAFIEFDTAVLGFDAGASFYSNQPFPNHVRLMANAQAILGRLDLDGFDDFNGPGIAADSLLATLSFNVTGICTLTSLSLVHVDMGQFMLFSRLAIDGVAIQTKLSNTGNFRADEDPPAISNCPANASYQCEDEVPLCSTAGLLGVDNCVNAGDLFIECMPDTDNGGAGCAANPLVITRTWRVTDLTCNVYSECTQTITVIDNTNPVINKNVNLPTIYLVADAGSCSSDFDPPPPVLQTTDNCTAPENLTFLCSRSDNAGASGADTCLDCTPVGNGIFFGDTSDNTESDNSSCIGSATIDEWYCYTAPCTDIATASLCGSSYNTTIAVFDACGGNELACNDDSDFCGPGSVQSEVSWAAAAGQTYYIRVSGFNNSTGAFSLELSCGFSGGIAAGGDCTAPYPCGQTITLTWIAVDECGNMSAPVDQDLFVECSAEVNITIELQSVVVECTRCIRFVMDDCTIIDQELDFTIAEAGATATFSGPAEIPCGSWTSMCVKDQQHTLYETVALTLNSSRYDAAGIVTLRGGDTNDDSIVEVQDVSWLLNQWGMIENPGGCPWDGTRDATFACEGAVGNNDLAILSLNWFTGSVCECTLDSGDGGGGFAIAASSHIQQGDSQHAMFARAVIPIAELEPDLGENVNLYHDAVFDWRDVEIFEALFGLPDTLSRKMRASTPVRPSFPRSIVR